MQANEPGTAKGKRDVFDVVVTVPKPLWHSWLAEGDLPGQVEWPCFFCGKGYCDVCRGAGRQRTGEAEWHFYLGGKPPAFRRGARCYVVAHGRLRGYAPLTGIETFDRGFAFVRQGNARACTIDERIRGFQGWRYRWWPLDDEYAFPNWTTEGVTAPSR